MICLTFSSVNIVEDVWHCNSLILIRLIVIKVVDYIMLITSFGFWFEVIKLLVSSVLWYSRWVCPRLMFGSWISQDIVSLTLWLTDLLILCYLKLSVSRLSNFNNSQVRETQSSNITIWILLTILYISWENYSAWSLELKGSKRTLNNANLGLSL